MNCSRCGAELSGSATFCPRCGLPRYDNEMSSTTLPPLGVSTSQLALANSYTSPYLPAGAPPWPTTIPQYFPRATRATTDAPLVPSAGTAVPKKRRSARGVLTAIALLILIPLLGAGLTYGSLFLNGQARNNAPQAIAPITIQPTAQPTATTGSPGATSTVTGNTLPTPTSFLAISANAQKTLGIIVKYPNSWTEDPVNNSNSDGSVSIALHPQQQGLPIALFIAKIPMASASGVSGTADINQAEISSLGNINGVSNLQMVRPSSPQRTIGGSQWDEQDATFSTSSGLFRVFSVTVKRSQNYYNILYLSPDTYYNEADQKYIQPMLQSFRFA